MRLIYNIIGCPHVALLPKEGKVEEFIFSTRDAEGIVTVVKQRVGE